MAKKPKTQYGASYRKLVEELFGQKNPKITGVTAGVNTAAESRLGLQLPAALREYYAELGAFHKLNEAHNRIVPPADLELVEGVLVFYEENQCVCLWGIRTKDLASDNDNPLVYQGTCNETWQWHSAEMKTDEFLRLVIYQQAAWGALEYGFEHPDAREAISAIEGTWEKVAGYLDLRIWKQRGILVSHLDHDKTCYFAGQDRSALQALQKRFGLSGK